MNLRHHPATITAAVYALSVLAMATVSCLVPLMTGYADVLGSDKSALALGIALFSVPAAALAAIGGGVIDRIGLRPSLAVAGLLIIGGDVMVYAAQSVWMLYAAMLVAGSGYSIVAVGAPAVLMATLDGSARIKSVSFWSTYAPTGFSIGLLIAAALAGGPYWRATPLFHAGLLLLATLFALVALPAVQPLPAGETARRERLTLSGLLAIFRDRAVVLLAIAIAIPNAISYGTSLITPSYFAEAHNISLAASATAVALGKILAMMTGGVIIGQLLSRNGSSRKLFIALVLVGMIAQVLIYLPYSPFPLALAALVLWLFAFGGISGLGMAMLPTIVPEPGRRAAASGVLNQAISLLSFLTPSLVFSLTGWTQFVSLAVGGLLLCIVAFPVSRDKDDATSQPVSA